MPAYRVYLTISGASAFAGSCAYTLALVYQLRTVGLGPLQLVVVGTALEVVCLIAQVPTGIIADLYSRRLSVIIGILLSGLASLLEGLAPVFLVILAATALWVWVRPASTALSRHGPPTRSASSASVTSSPAAPR